MSIYVIFLERPNVAAWNQVRHMWPNRHHIVHETVALVAPEEVTLTREIAVAVGIASESTTGATGLVVEFAHHYGFADRALVEWLDKFS